MIAAPAGGRRAHRGVGRAVGEPGLATRASTRPTTSPPACTARPRPTTSREMFVRDGEGEPLVAKWWMGTGSPVDFTSPAAEAWWREQAKNVLALGVAGHQGRRRRRLVHPRRRAVRRRHDRRAVRLGTRPASTAARCSARSTRCTPATGVLFGRPGWTGQQAVGHHLGRRSAERLLVAAHARRGDAHRRRVGLQQLVARRRRLPRREARRPLPEGAAAALGAVRLLHAADARARALRAGGVDLRRGDARGLPRPRAAARAPRPYMRAAAATAARTGLPIVRPLALTDPADGAAGRSPTPTGTARRCGSRRCWRTARARSRSTSRAATGSTWDRAEHAGGGSGRAGAAGSHPGVGAARGDRRHLPGGARRARPGRHAGARAAAGGDAVGRAAVRPGGRPAGRGTVVRFRRGQWSVRRVTGSVHFLPRAM